MLDPKRMILAIFGLAACSGDPALVDPTPPGSPSSVTEEVALIVQAQSVSAADAAAGALANCTCYYSYNEECPIGWECSQKFEDFGCRRREAKGGTLAGACTKNAAGRGDCKTDADCRNGAPCLDGKCMRLVADCDGQCAPAEKGTVCGVEPRDALVNFAAAWTRGVVEVASGPGGQIGVDVEALGARFGISSECAFYLSRASLGLTELCLGPEVIGHPAEEHSVEEHSIEHLEEHECQQRIALGCGAMLVEGLRDPSRPIDLYEFLPPNCGPVRASRGCYGLDPEACLGARLSSLVRSLTTPLQD